MNTKPSSVHQPGYGGLQYTGLSSEVSCLYDTVSAQKTAQTFSFWQFVNVANHHLLGNSHSQGLTQPDDEELEDILLDRLLDSLDDWLAELDCDSLDDWLAELDCDSLDDWLAELDCDSLDDWLAELDCDSLDPLLADDSLDEEDSLTDENNLLEP
jgi:hypothetical protein